jgi:hypothetical protein
MKKIFRQPKRRGELAELRFLLRAAEEGIAVSKPYGDSERFDFVVGSRQPLYRVQVRSTRILNNTGAYVCRFTHGPLLLRYSRHDFDFLALYVVPCNAWYILPVAVLLPARLYVSVYPHHPNTRSRLEPFREAWRLLRRPKPRTKPRKARPRLRRQTAARRAGASRRAI